MSNQRVFNLTVCVAALGYFVDVFDLFLFSILRVRSLKDLGISDADSLQMGLMLLNSQMAGLLIGGILWGVLGDKRGRVSVLFGSILLYSVANVANAFVTDVYFYALLRFIAGVGLAGEVGAAITLVAEILPKEKRGLGTMLVGGIGLSGSVVAAFTAEYLSWRNCYLLGGVLGLVLLVLRLKLQDPELYLILKKREVARGRLLSLFSSRERTLKYFSLIAVGLPIWFVIGILITFSPEFAKTLNILQPVAVGRAVMFTYIGVVLGDFASSILSQRLQSRRLPIAASLVLLLTLATAYLQVGVVFDGVFYWLCGVIGFSTGYWVVLMTMAAEKFGTNMRATVTTTVPNFIRGAAVPITLTFQALSPTMGIIGSAQVLAVVTTSIALAALYGLGESFNADLDFIAAE
jgi:MFS transporter, putative metabolite:H+ symporter